MQDISVAPILKDMYLYLTQNRLPSSEAAIRKVETLAKKYILLDFIIVQNNVHPRKRWQF